MSLSLTQSPIPLAIDTLLIPWFSRLDGLPEDPKSNLWPLESEIPGFYKGIAEYYGGVSCPFFLKKKPPF